MQPLHEMALSQPVHLDGLSAATTATRAERAGALGAAARAAYIDHPGRCPKALALPAKRQSLCRDMLPSSSRLKQHMLLPLHHNLQG